ncbi:MAG TPA: hypothetical protein VNO19_03060 [Gemmatimonadales bacterium]|nr:hypothetical protein [Gemmatimonadales bacterium]
MMSSLRASLLILGLSALIACGDDSTGPTVASVAGTYHATQVDLIQPDNSVIDGLALGVTLEIVLTPQGTTSGTLVIPAVLTEDGIEDDVLDLTGTFTVSGNTVTFQGQGDNLIPELPWTIGNGTLTASDADAEGTIQVTLTRS